MNATQRAAIRTWIATELDITTIWVRQPQDGGPLAPRPPRPYAALRLGPPTFVSRPVSQGRPVGVEDDELRDLYQVAERTLTVSIFARTTDEAAAKLEALQLCRTKLSTSLALTNANIAILRTLETFEPDELEGPEWQGRAEWSIRLGYTLSGEEDRGVIDATTFQIDLHDPERQVVVEVDVNE